MKNVDDLIDSAADLAEHGLSKGEIADELNVSRETASWLVERGGGNDGTEAAATTSPARVLKEKYGREITDFDSPSDFVAATAGEADPSTGRSSANDPDEVAHDVMTFAEKVEFQASNFDSPAAFLKDRNGVSVASVDEPGEYHKAVAEKGEQ